MVGVARPRSVSVLMTLEHCEPAADVLEYPISSPEHTGNRKYHET